MKKRVLSLFLALCMLVTFMPTMVLANEDDPVDGLTDTVDITVENVDTLSVDDADITEITELGSEYITVIDEAGGYVYYSFTPSESGYYKFYTTGNYDTYSYLYDADWNLLTENDDYDNEVNTLIKYEMEAGVTYYLGYKFLSSSKTGSFSVYAEACDSAVSAELVLTETLTYMECVDSYTEYDDEDEAFTYYEFDLSNFADGDEIIVTYSDDSTITYTFNGTRFYDEDGNRLYYNVSSTQYTEHWEVGGTYYFTLTLYNNDDVTVEVPVTIVEYAYEDATVELVLTQSIVRIEGVNSYLGEYEYYDEDEGKWYEGTYSYYSFSMSMFSEGDQIIITLSDGSQIIYTHNGSRFYDEDGNSLSYSSSSTQSSSHWETGNTYYFTMTLTDYAITVEVPVTIAAADISFVQSDGVTASMMAEYIADAYIQESEDGFYIYFSLTEEGTSYVETIYRYYDYSVDDDDYSYSILSLRSDGYYRIWVEDSSELPIVLGMYVNSMSSMEIVFITVTAATTDTVTATSHIYDGDYAWTWADDGLSAVKSATCTVCGEVDTEKAITAIWGSTRYSTANTVAEEAFPDGCTYAVIADGRNFPDALAAASLAGAVDGPVLVTNDNNAASTIEELNALGVTSVYIVGGTSSVSEAVEEAIEAAGITVAERLAGSSRVETALKVAEKVLELTADDPSDTCIISTSGNYPDVLCASAYSYWASAPIYFTNTSGTSLSSATLEAIKEGGYSNVVIVGGTGSVSEDVEDAITALGVNVTRLGGDNRYATAVLIAEWSVEQGMSYDNAAVATGTNFPDALVASALCGQKGSVLLLSNPTASKNTTLTDVLTESADKISNIYVVGGESSVSTDVRKLIADALD